MLEIILLIYLTKNIGRIASEKGYAPGLYKTLSVISWIFFEIIGLIFGIILVGEGFGVYGFGLLGAGFGYLMIYLYVTGLQDQTCDY